MTKQIFNAVEAIKLAYVSHTPIVWLVTDYKEVASQVAEQFVCEHLGSFREPAPGLIKGPVQLKEFSIKDRLNYTPDVYYKWVSPDDTYSCAAYGRKRPIGCATVYSDYRFTNTPKGFVAQ